MRKEIICINVGQAGVQMSNASWELFCIEHGLDASGYARNNFSDSANYPLEHDLGTFFQTTSSGRYVPRAINVDLEPTVIDEIRCGPYRKLWHPNGLLNGLEDAANNWARGRYTAGRKFSPKLINQIVRLARESRSLHGFILLFSIGGGTGAGLGSLILDTLDTEFSKYPRVVCVVNPAPQLSCGVVEPYNAVLSTASALIEQADLVISSDNESLYDVCKTRLDVQQPTFFNLNKILAQLFSSLTVNFRFVAASLDHDLGHLQTNLVPYPRIHFPFANYAPLYSLERHEHELQSSDDLTHLLFEPSSQLVKLNVSSGKYMACCLQYRGLVTPREVTVALIEVKKRHDVQFVDWCPTGFKIGLSPVPPGVTPNSKIAPSMRNVTMFSNSTAFEQVWRRILQKFDLLYFKKSFVHWYVGEGMEEGEFKQSKEMLYALQSDYFSLSEDVEISGMESRNVNAPIVSSNVPTTGNQSYTEKDNTEKDNTEPVSEIHLNESFPNLHEANVSNLFSYYPDEVQSIFNYRNYYQSSQNLAHLRSPILA